MIFDKNFFVLFGGNLVYWVFDVGIGMGIWVVDYGMVLM